MRSSIRRLSRFALLIGLGVIQTVACSSDSRRDTSEQAATGTVSLPLRATAASGNVYRLRNAFFQITDVRSGGVVAFLFSEDDPDRTLLTSILDTGDYTVTLQPGWFMERLLSGGGGGNGGSAGFAGEPSRGGFTSSGGFVGVGGAVEEGGVGGSFDDGPPDLPSKGGASTGGAFSTGGLTTSTGGAFSTGGLTTSTGGTRPTNTGGTAGFFSTGGTSGEQAVFVEAQLLSPAVQFFSIFSRSDSFVNFSFQIGGEVINFNQGRVNISIDVTEAEPQCDSPPNVTRPERVLLENDATALGNIRLTDVFDALASNGGFQGSGLRLYQEIYDSYASAGQARLPDAVHCGDELTNGAPSLNGYPIRCDRAERFHVDDIENFFAIAAVNRLDFTPANGANCGQQRMVFANNTRNRAFMIVEAQVPNPHPELGAEGCKPLAQFWLDQNGIDDPFVRGQRLSDAFLVGQPELLAAGFGPFYTATNLTVGSGQIRTNQFDEDPWTLREFKLALDGTSLKAIPFPVAEAPNGALWNENSGLPQGEACRENFLSAMQGLLTGDMAQMSFVVDQACKDGESQNDFSQDYDSNMSGGFRDILAQNLVGTGLTPSDIANRARFAGSCIGCHNESSSAKLGGGLVAPISFDFPHIQEFASLDCGARNQGTVCFPTSVALKTVFLPSRLNTLANLAGVPIVTDPCENGGSGGAGGGSGGGGKFSTGGFFATGGTVAGGFGSGGAASTGGIPGKGTPAPEPISDTPAPVVTIELPQADTPLDELMTKDAEIRAQYGERTISGRSAQATH